MSKFRRFIKTLVTGIDKATIGFGYCAGGLTLALLGVVLVSIAFRYLLDRPIMGADEISCYLFIAFNLAALSYATYGESHVAAEVLYARFNNKLQFAVTVASYALAFIVCSLITYYGTETTWHYFSRGWTSSSMAAITLWPIVATIPIGFTMFGLQCLSRIYAITERMRRTGSVGSSTPFET